MEADRLRAQADRLRRENEAQAAESAELRRRLAAAGDAAERADERERETEAVLAAGRVELAASEAKGERLHAGNTELAASRAALARSEAYVRAMLESSTDYAIIAADPAGRITEWNAGARATMGWNRDEMLGRDAAMIFTPEDRAVGVPELEMATALAEGRATDERWHLKRDGSRFWAVGTMMPLRDGAGAAIGFLKVLRDRTEQRRAEQALQRLNETLEARVVERTAELREALDRLRGEALERERAEGQLRQSQKMEAVGQLTGGIAHDFNNMLQGIAGSLELMQTRLRQGRVADLERYLGAARVAAGRAAALTHRLLAFSRQQALDPKPVDVDRLVAGMEELIRRTAGPAVAVETVRTGGLWTALCDPHQLENALLNLCINARDAMPGGGRLTIETANAHLDERGAETRDVAPGHYVALCVSDTGAGMPPEVLARAFDPFFTTKPIGQGTGLGLSMVYGFVRQSGGQVGLYSEPGQGTTAKLYLPRHHGAPEEAAEAAAPSGAPRAGAGETVLVVDDEPTVRMLVAEVLADLGYAAIEAGDGASGLRVLRSDVRVDLLVTDVGLPGGMNGRQLADAARAARPGLKVLFITGYAENAAIGADVLEPGMQVMTKPFALEVLAGKIRAMIEG